MPTGRASEAGRGSESAAAIIWWTAAMMMAVAGWLKLAPTRKATRKECHLARPETRGPRNVDALVLDPGPPARGAGGAGSI